MVAPTSAPILHMVPFPVQERLSAPGPKYSIIDPVPPLTLKIPANFRIISLGEDKPLSVPDNLTPIDALMKLNEIKKLLKTENLFDTINNLLLENKKLSKVQSKFLDNKNKIIKDSLLRNMKQKNKFNLLISQCKIDSMDSLKKISYEIKNQINNLILVLAADISNKPFIIVMIDDKVNKLINIDAREIILKLAKHINGSGGGQSFFSTAGGKNLSGLKNVIKDANQIFNKIIS